MGLAAFHGGAAVPFRGPPALAHSIGSDRAETACEFETNCEQQCDHSLCTLHMSYAASRSETVCGVPLLELLMHPVKVVNVVLE